MRRANLDAATHARKPAGTSGRSRVISGRRSTGVPPSTGRAALPSPHHAFKFLLAAASLIAGGVASVVGFGIGSLLTPTLALETGTKLAVAAVAIPHFVGSLQRFWLLRSHVDRRVLFGFGVASAAGGLAGALLHTRVSNRGLAVVFGALLILAGVSEISGWIQRVHWGRRAAWIAGALSAASAASLEIREEFARPHARLRRSANGFRRDRHGDRSFCRRRAAPRLPRHAMARDTFGVAESHDHDGGCRDRYGIWHSRPRPHPRALFRQHHRRIFLLALGFTWLAGGSA